MRNRIVEAVEVTDMAATGKALARIDGQVVFIEKAIPGDCVDIKIIRAKKSFLEAIVVDYKQLSDLRVKPVCDYFGICGGCKWQNIDYSQQLRFKQGQVEENLMRIGKVDLPPILPILPSEVQFGYRNKLEYTFTNYRWLTQEEVKSEEKINRNGVGFHMSGHYDRVVDVHACHLQEDISNEIRNELRDYALKNDLSFHNVKKFKGFLRNLIIRTATTGQVMVILQVGDDDAPLAETVLNHLSSRFPQVTSFYYVINLKMNDSYVDQDMIYHSGEKYILEKMNRPDDQGEVSFQISPKSFYQTNSKQAEKLYQLAWKYAEFKGDEHVYDLYTGTGTIACYIAKAVKSVIGIEYVEDAVKDARVNAALNGIENARFFAGDMKEVLSDSFAEKHGYPDVIITDPPRAGMHKEVTLKLLALNPRRIIYISCNPATQARDLELLSERYKVTTVQPVDMFPHTPHVENIVVLELA